MKKLLIFLALFAFLSCQKKDCGCVTPPLGSELNGTWKLVKLTYGFSQISVSGTKLPMQETIDFDIANTSYRRVQNGNLIGEGKISISTDEKSFPNQLVINYLNENTYQVYNLSSTDGRILLVLYEKATKGSYVADGSTFYYEKQ